MSSFPDYVLDDLTVTEKDTRTQIKHPRMFKVIMLNDDYTPMDFVVEILRYFYQMDEQEAIRVMLGVHHKGYAICGIYTREIAETKSALTNEYARAHQYPLLCRIEPEDEDTSCKG